MKPFLILQLRSLDAAADNEFEAFLKYGKLDKSDVHRVRMESESFADIDAADYAGIIVGGGPANVSDEEDTKPDDQRRFEQELDQLYAQIFEKDIPYLGSCYGLGSLMRYAGGTVSREKYAEKVGHTKVFLTDEGKEDPLLRGLEVPFNAFCGHKEACQDIPKGAVLLATSENCLVQIIRFKDNIYATQFHCELDALGIARRIRFYRHHGYFKPDEAGRLIEHTRDVKAEHSHAILRRFVEKYGSLE